jgi:hypothetical protein
MSGHARAPPPRPAPAIRATKAGIRLIKESVFSNLKRQMRLEQHLAKTIRRPRPTHRSTPAGLTLGIFINLLVAAPHAPWPPTTADEPTSSL